MRSALLPLIVFILTAGFAVAENEDKEQKPVVKRPAAQKPAEGFKQERVARLRGGKFSRMFLSISGQTRQLDLSNEQKDALGKISEKYSETIIDDENKSREFQRKFLKALQSGEFDPLELKTLSKDIEAANLKAANSFIDGVAEIKETIGPENFARLKTLKKVNRHALIQLRQERAKRQMQTQEAAKDTTTKSK
ncbi:MAG: hypothetical protein DHS20C13_19820 [Thermodesulfobacteriota bacterium]|nr:MAG: hypothetical protein DHS20C13_19820 [Thermodesulfobacteriota bacterium]